MISGVFVFYWKYLNVRCVYYDKHRYSPHYFIWSNGFFPKINILEHKPQCVTSEVMIKRCKNYVHSFLYLCTSQFIIKRSKCKKKLNDCLILLEHENALRSFSFFVRKDLREDSRACPRPWPLWLILQRMRCLRSNGEHRSSLPGVRRQEKCTSILLSLISGKAVFFLVLSDRFF